MEIARRGAISNDEDFRRFDCASGIEDEVEHCKCFPGCLIKRKAPPEIPERPCTYGLNEVSLPEKRGLPSARLQSPERLPRRLLCGRLLRSFHYRPGLRFLPVRRLSILQRELPSRAPEWKRARRLQSF